MTSLNAPSPEMLLQMSSTDPDRLYKLLPGIIRIRDIEAGQPLRALLRIIAEQVNLIERDIGQLYDNWFIETCQDWVVPYLGDLINYRPLSVLGLPGQVIPAEGRLRNSIITPRCEVADTLRLRRRKGTLVLLERLAADVAHWPARAVEFAPLVGTTVNINHFHPHRGHTLDLRHAPGLEMCGGPFDTSSHWADIRRISSHRVSGRYNLPSVGLFVWRLLPIPINRAPAYCLEDTGGRHRFTFSILGNDTPLFTKPATQTDPPHPAGALDLPIPIRRRAFQQPPALPGHHRWEASDDYYGIGKSLCIWKKIESDWEQIRAESIIPADLSEWGYEPAAEHVAVDPEYGRILFPPDEAPPGLLVSYHHGFSAAIGGGGYLRRVTPANDRKVYIVAKEGEQTAADEKIYHSIREAYDAAGFGKKTANQDSQKSATKPLDAIIEIRDSRAYSCFGISLEENQHLEIRAADGERPAIRMLDEQPDQADALCLTGKANSRLTFEGLLIVGRGFAVSGTLKELSIRHCTLVPGWSIQSDCTPSCGKPSIQIDDSVTCLHIDHSIVGSIRVVEAKSRVWNDPICMKMTDSIIDGGAPGSCAIAAAGGGRAHAQMTVQRATIIGRTLVRQITLAEGSLFIGNIDVTRRQRGCIRFCYVPPDSHTPPRYECEPDLVIARAKETGCACSNVERHRVRPRFVSLRYGTPGYCRLCDTCAEEIRAGAEDESEMGVFHDLFEPQRLAALRARLEEFTPAAADAGVILDSFDDIDFIAGRKRPTSKRERAIRHDEQDSY